MYREVGGLPVWDLGGSACIVAYHVTWTHGLQEAGEGELALVPDKGERERTTAHLSASWGKGLASK